MEATFVRIRGQSNSKLPNQKQAAGLLVAVEDSIKNQQTTESEQTNPLAYFGTLMTVLQQQEEIEIIEAALYLLAIVFPYCPSSVLKVKFLNISEVFFRIAENHSQHTPVMKSLITSYEYLLIAQDSKVWSAQPKSGQIFSLLIHLSLDQRPKLRKIALDSCRRILRHPPPPTLYHPASSIVISILHQRVHNLFTEKDNSRDVHFLQTLQFLLPELLQINVTEICKDKLVVLSQALTGLPTSLLSNGNTIAVELTFSVLCLFFTAESSIFSPLDLKTCIDSLHAMRPHENDAISGSWANLICVSTAKLIQAIELNASNTDDDLISKPLLKIFKKGLIPFASSTNASVITEVFSYFATFIEQNLITDRVFQLIAPKSSTLNILSDIVLDCIGDIKFIKAWGGLLSVLKSLVKVLSNHCLGLSTTIITKAMNIRDDAHYEAFGYKKELETLISFSITAIGVHKFLDMFPLNIYEEGTKRPYLAPIIVKAVETSSSSHSLQWCASTLLPLVRNIFRDSIENKSKGKEMESKVYETIGHQLLLILPGVCQGTPFDLDVAMKEFCDVVGPIVRSHESDSAASMDSILRPIICLSLSELINPVWDKYLETNLGLNHINVLKRYSTKFLAVLCSNYVHSGGVKAKSIDSPNSKGHLIQGSSEKENAHTEAAIKSFLKLANPDAVNNYFMTLVKSILQLQTQVEETTPSAFKIYATLDLLLMLLPHLSVVQNIKNKVNQDDIMSSSSPLSVFYMVLSGNLQSNDSTLQKKTYKSLNRMISTLIDVECTNAEISPLCSRIMERLIDADVLECTAQSAKKARIELVGKVVSVSLLTTMQEFIPVCLPEVILCTKEANEKARMTGFEVLMIVARKLRTVDDSLDDKMGEEFPPLCFNSLLMMLLAGLAGSTANMQSAAISCLAKVLYEFRDLPAVQVRELISTIMLTFSSPQKEIIKAGIGFVKVVILILSTDVLMEHMQNIVVGLLQHAKHPSFRIKIRHVFERLVKRFGYDAIEIYVPEEEKKMVQYIRKIQNNKKNKKESATKDMVQSDLHKEVNDVDEDDELDLPELFEKMSTRGGGGRIKENGADVIDFLDKSIVSQVADPIKRKLKPQGEDFKLSKEGKMIFDDSDEESKPKKVEDYYMQAMEGNEDSFERLPNGKIKFKKRKHDEFLLSDGENEQETIQSKTAKKENSKIQQMLGRQYKAKKAKGDVKKAGMPDPFAYIPLNSKQGSSRKANANSMFKSVVNPESRSSVDAASSKKIGTKKGNKKHK